MNRVNIILAAYNGEKYIIEQIETIIKSGFTHWKLWVFDDGSTDGTRLIVEDYERKYPDKIVYKQNERNKGVTLNFLEGLCTVESSIKTSKDVLDKGASGDKSDMNNYYMFCDQDDAWMPDKIERTLRQMKKVEKKYGINSPAAVYTDAVVVDDKLKVLSSSFYKVSKLDTRRKDIPHLMMENKLIGCTVMINEALVNKITVLPQNARYHDWWIGLIASAFGHISYLPKPTLYYRQHSGNVVGNQNFTAYVKNRFSSLNKQKEAIHKCILQAKEFYDIYNQDLSETTKNEIYIFANLNKKDYIERKKMVIRHGYLKTGILRNIGLLFIV